MRPLPLEQIRLNWRSHSSVLWWLGLLYRKPEDFKTAIKQLPPRRALVCSMKIYLHIIPWLFLFSIIGLLFSHVILNLPPAIYSADFWTLFVENLQNIAGEIVIAIAVGIAVGIFFGIDEGITTRIAFAITFGIAFGIAFEILFVIASGIASGIAVGIAVGIAGGIAIGITFGIAFGIASRIAGGIVIGIAVGMTIIIAVLIAAGIGVGIATGFAGVIAVGITFGIAFGIARLRLYYLLPNLFFIWLRTHASWYHFHPVVWDDLCAVPFPGLDRLLISYATKNPEEAEREINRLIDHYPSQRKLALKAITILQIRRCGAVFDFFKIAEIVSRLPQGNQGYLAQTEQIKKKISELCNLQARLDTITRVYLHEPWARTLVAEIESFRAQVAGMEEPLASEFRNASSFWLQQAQQQLDGSRNILLKNLTPQVFRAGEAIDRQQEAFVERNLVMGELESQIMLSTGCPGLLLYGRRRVGKSTVLKNISAFLPSRVHVVTISMQNAQALISVESLARLIEGSIHKECQDLGLPELESAGLVGLFSWLNEFNEVLMERSERLLLALDEYETIDNKIGAGVLPLDLLASMRDSIQSHRQITWILSGSHHITEQVNAAWPSYLVSMRTIQVPMFNLEETRLLLTEPLRHSEAWSDNEAKRPHIDAIFWGEQGIERIHEEAGGWPCLVQLLAQTAVDIVNNSSATSLNEALWNSTLDKAIDQGDVVLRLLMQTESALPGEWSYLMGFKSKDFQEPPNDEALYTSLSRRLLVIEESNQWRLRVPLLQRWLRKKI